MNNVERLKELVNSFDNGLISEDEYDIKGFS
jgi:hypothetical protein